MYISDLNIFYYIIQTYVQRKYSTVIGYFEVIITSKAVMSLLENHLNMSLYFGYTIYLHDNLLRVYIPYVYPTTYILI